MCGIVGTYGPPGSRHDWVTGACEALQHRGPDGLGVWSDKQAGVALGHRRLAILDLSEAGRQPMTSADGRYHIVFNGEIYNHLELRAALKHDSWRGHSDTETVLACLVEWGIEKTLRELVGMFAFAVFDVAERQLLLARDRFGEKPLYYGYAGPSLVFASELRPAQLAPGFNATIDRTALALYMRRSYVPAPSSIYVSMRKLLPGSWLSLTSAHIAARALPEPRIYWSAVEAALAGEREPIRADDAEVISMLDAVLARAVKGQMLSDVPLGAFLSGGIDSSTVVALMQRQSTRPVKTFSIGFEEPEYDESGGARAVASHLGTEHTELRVRADDALALVPRIPFIYDEPFADSSQLPTFLVAQLARSQVTVALSGDGGDELFSGYNRYFIGSRAWPYLARIPLTVRRSLARGAQLLPVATWDRLARIISPVLPSRFRVAMPGDKIHKAADVLTCRDGEELYGRLVSQGWMEPPVLNGTPARSDVAWPPLSDLTHQMMLLDAVSYLPDDILAKVDRAAMAVSLETRVPMLDHRVFEFAWRLPMGMKIRDGQGKWALRQLLYRHVPRAIVERPKMGFGVPLDSWLRGSLRDWAGDLFSESRLRSEGYLDAPTIARCWQEHLSGRRNWQYQLWNVLMFEAWLDATTRNAARSRRDVEPPSGVIATA